MATQPVDQILDQSVAAYQAKDHKQAAKLLAEAIKIEPNNERAWLWLSGIVATDAERLYCMKRLLAVNPQNEIAQQGISILPTGLTPVQPSLEKAHSANVEICTFPGCDQPVTKIGFKYCYKHWKALNAPEQGTSILNATSLGEKLGLSSQRMNLVLAELGWITRNGRGWDVTPQGTALGGLQDEFRPTGVPFVNWPESIVHNRVLVSTVNGLSGANGDAPQRPNKEASSFRDKYPASNRATDGHLVRSKGEMLIDNWLYMAGITHAYERQLPVEEDAMCDFYIPAGKLYIEYWGIQNDVNYAARKKAKLEVYKKHGLNLIELTDEHIKNLDDHLPKMLLKHGIVFN